MVTNQVECSDCGTPYPAARHALGYTTCLACGEVAARSVKHCIVPLHKSNYVPVTNYKDIPGMCSKTNYTHGKDSA